MTSRDAQAVPVVDPVTGLIITAILVMLRRATWEFYRRLMDAVDHALVDHAEQILGSVPGVMDRDHVRIAVTAEHQLRHALPRLSAALVRADPQAHEGTDYHAEQASYR